MQLLNSESLSEAISYGSLLLEFKNNLTLSWENVLVTHFFVYNFLLLFVNFWITNMIQNVEYSENHIDGNVNYLNQDCQGFLK